MKLCLNKTLVSLKANDDVEFKAGYDDLPESIKLNCNGEITLNTLEEFNQVLKVLNAQNIKIIEIQP